MPLRQFINSLEQLWQSEGTSFLGGLARHIWWQWARTHGRFPMELKFSRSRLIVTRPSGVAALVNSMGLYDFNNMNLVVAVLSRTHGTFFDVGANIGTYSLLASEVEGAKVVAFEPHPAAFAALTNNLAVNNRANVLALNVALSESDGVLHLTNGLETSTNRVVGPGESMEGSLRVQCRALDNVCREVGFRPTIVKIDVEGHDLEVLRGFRDQCGDTFVLLVENGASLQIRELLCQMGFDGLGTSDTD